MNIGNATIKGLLASATRTTDANGTGVDCAEYDGVVAVTLNSSAGSGDMTLDVKLQSSDTSGGTYADIAGAAFTRVTTTASSQVIFVNVAETSRFIRAVVDVGGTSPSFIVGCQIVGEPKYV